MVARLRRFFDIRPGEGLPVLLSFTYIGVVIAAYVLAKAIRNGLFIQAYGPYALRYVVAAIHRVEPVSPEVCFLRRSSQEDGGHQSRVHQDGSWTAVQVRGGP